ncbi:protein disulfide-isomerase A3-like [Paramacrobiotus metropolitanus]|uniref:protein disulfide-isomerase A3-like n=1 Tax=Paramacrobiotus metropolitanus TaxID=2943436 RepID=UPI002445FD13|nr:protein disulfide-isomerase A3-like [Paramacrobiotus metropolitanus]
MWLRVVFFGLAACLAAASDVLEFTDADFSSKIGDHPVILVEFFAPWCGHCKRLAPEYEKAATSLKKEDPPVPIAKVDCTANTETCQKYGVSGYPTLKIFRNGEFSKEYSGPREADGIVRTMRTEAGPSSKELHSEADLAKFLESAEAVVVGYLSAGNDKLKEWYTKAADTMKEELRFAHTTNEKLFGQHKDKAVLYRPKRLHNKFEPEHVGFESTVENLKQSIKDAVHGLVGHKTTSNTANFPSPLLTVYYDVDYTKNPKGSNYWRNRILKVVSSQIEKLKSKLSFAVASVGEFAHELTEFGLDSADQKKPVAAIRDEQHRKFVMKDDFSVENLEKFVSDYLANKLEPYMKSEPVPEDNTKGVRVVVGKNFEEIVNDADKDVLIEFYAPWCGHCKKLAPIYDELAEKLKDETEITIAKMDATANDVPSGFDVRGFPTLYFVPKGDKKNPKQYNGGREVDDFIKYLAKESTNPLKGFDRTGKPKKTEL